MRPTWELLRREPRAAIFFGALTQSSLGTGAGYVALLLIAYDRWESAWVISVVLAADFVPAMLLGPVFGAIADRFSRRYCTIAADLLRAVAFIGIALLDGLATTVALAALAGAGTGLFNPAALASLPSLVKRERLPAATALYGAVADLGFTLGPALAALVLLLGGPEEALLLNGATFAVSALALTLLRFGSVPPRSSSSRRLAPTLLRDALDGVQAASGLTGIPAVLLSSSVALFFGGAFNVAEVIFATEELGAGDVEFSLLVTAFGLGFISGSLSGSRGGGLPVLKRRFLAGLALLGLGYVGTGLTSSVVGALGALAVAGFGNGLLIVYERLLIQATVPDELTGRIFGIRDALGSWAFALSFATAGALIALAGVRATVLLAGAGGILAWLSAIAVLRRTWNATEARPRLTEVAVAWLGRFRI